MSPTQHDHATGCPLKPELRGIEVCQLNELGWCIGYIITQLQPIPPVSRCKLHFHSTGLPR